MSEAFVKVQIPDGWELACDEMRPPKQGEFYLIARDEVQCRAAGELHLAIPRVIVRRKWEWPAWLKAEWLFQTNTQKWLATSVMPVLCDSYWYLAGEYFTLDMDALDFTPPPCDDWRLSLRRNPAFGQMED